MLVRWFTCLGRRSDISSKFFWVFFSHLAFFLVKPLPKSSIVESPPCVNTEDNMRRAVFFRISPWKYFFTNLRGRRMGTNAPRMPVYLVMLWKVLLEEFLNRLLLVQDENVFRHLSPDCQLICPFARPGLDQASGETVLPRPAGQVSHTCGRWHTPSSRLSPRTVNSRSSVSNSRSPALSMACARSR